MGANVQQRGFAFMDTVDARCMGGQVQDCSTMPADKKQVTMSRCSVERNGNMEGGDICAMEASDSDIKTSHEISLANESRFCGEWPAEKVEQLTQIRKTWLESYLKTGSPTETAKIMGVRNVKEVSSRITRIARQLGFDSATAMKVAAGVKTEAEQSANHTQLIQLLERQGFKCVLSGEALSPTTARLDHKMAVSRGGSHDIANLQWVTDEVNRAKGTMSNDQFIAVCRRVAIWAK